MADVVLVVALLLVAGCATAAVAHRDPARQALVLSVLGVVLAVLFTVLQAPDVALSQLAVGSALTPLLIMLSVRKVRRRAAGSAQAGSAETTRGESGAKDADSDETGSEGGER